MVVEKLKEREDKKDELEDAKMLVLINQDILMCRDNIKDYKDKIKFYEDNLVKLYKQYFLIKWEHHILEQKIYNDIIL